ncbi:hypothetical protein I4U23_004597 [Adineta vaga]|nr:hypothetical protein I4U23_004597 [Adineta vaga]
MEFDIFYQFIMEKGSQLQVLRLMSICTLDYIDADRWERLITNSMSNLRVFDCEYKECIGTINESPTDAYHKLINRFSSPFGIQRQCMTKIKINIRLYETIDDLLVVLSISPLG